MNQIRMHACTQSNWSMHEVSIGIAIALAKVKLKVYFAYTYTNTDANSLHIDYHRKSIDYVSIAIAVLNICWLSIPSQSRWSCNTITQFYNFEIVVYFNCLYLHTHTRARLNKYQWTSKQDEVWMTMEDAWEQNKSI